MSLPHQTTPLLQHHNFPPETEQDTYALNPRSLESSITAYPKREQSVRVAQRVWPLIQLQHFLVNTYLRPYNPLPAS
jgi:hypothetical protein